MSMSMHVLAVKPADDEYKRKAAAYRACDAARVPVPQELVDFFDGAEPDDTGMTQSINGKHESCESWVDASSQGFQVNVTKLPPGTRFVRFYCSW